MFVMTHYLSIHLEYFIIKQKYNKKKKAKYRAVCVVSHYLWRKETAYEYSGIQLAYL